MATTQGEKQERSPVSVILVESGYLMRPWQVEHRVSSGEDLMTGRYSETDEYRLVDRQGRPILGLYEVYGPDKKPALDLIVEAVNRLSIGPQGQLEEKAPEQDST